MDNNVERKSCSFCGTRGRKGMRFAGGLGAMICESCVEHFHEVFHSAQKAKSATKPPWDAMTDAEILANIPLISQNAEQVSEFLVEWIELARSRKISWAEIGRVMGTSRQAAWERFSSRINIIRSSASSA